MFEGCESYWKEEASWGDRLDKAVVEIYVAMTSESRPTC